ncbi:hypothetical protein LRAMOSA05661 [Lichtheimia ramosa]|uniref:G-patch domain-containing protein n=1 Tax=Lichtheimia ramosa TaxID=688394 RepID=A0A077X1R5_9FUNG|nr:hypothetical protein LRAMOSA05661 [Lichtheimia ramosa]
MSAKLPFQKKAGFRPQFNRNNKFGFGDDDEDHDEQDQVSMVTGFEDNKLQELNDKTEETPLTITPVFSENWRTKRRKIFVPTGAATQSSTQTAQTPEVLGQQSQTFGLQVKSRSTTTAASTEDIQASTQVADTTVEDTTVEERVKTLDEQAAEALMKEATQDEDETGERIVIPAKDETEAFREDVKTRPDEATMEDYERVPVEQFGAALLRGLGWKEGEGIGRNRKNMPLPKPFEPAKQREALLGLGATPEDASNGKKKDRRSAYVYKETSLFKKVAKRNLEERDGGSSDTSEKSSSRNSSKSRHRSRSRSPGRSSRHSSKSRHRSRSRDRHSSSSSRHSSRHSSRERDSSRRRRRSRSRDSYRSSRR